MFKNFYYGKESLPRSFWFYFVIMNVIVLIAVLKGSGLFHEPVNKFDKPPAYIGVISLLIILAYRIFSIIGTWRCASNYLKTNPGWSTTVIAILVLSVVDLFFRIGLIFFLSFSWFNEKIVNKSPIKYGKTRNRLETREIN